MDKKDNFGTGFLLGTILGGIVGGIVGTVVANQGKNKENEAKLSPKNNYNINGESETNTEDLRLTLEEKINQLNQAIDEMKWNLTVNSDTDKN